MSRWFLRVRFRDENDLFKLAQVILLIKTAPQCEIHVVDPTSKPLPQYHFSLEGLTGSLDSSVIDIGGKNYLTLITCSFELYEFLDNRESVNLWK